MVIPIEYKSIQKNPDQEIAQEIRELQEVELSQKLTCLTTVELYPEAILDAQARDFEKAQAQVEKQFAPTKAKADAKYKADREQLLRDFAEGLIDQPTLTSKLSELDNNFLADRTKLNKKIEAHLDAAEERIFAKYDKKIDAYEKRHGTYEARLARCEKSATKETKAELKDLYDKRAFDSNKNLKKILEGTNY